MPTSTRLSDTLPGTWELVSRVDVTVSGRTLDEPSLGSDPVALIYYDRSGHFAAQFMKRDRLGVQADAAVAGHNNSRAQGGYDAYFGTYTVDDDRGGVTQHLVGSLSRENVGVTLTREMIVQGDALKIEVHTTSPQGEAVVRTLRWKRVG